MAGRADVDAQPSDRTAVPVMRRRPTSSFTTSQPPAVLPSAATHLGLGHATNLLESTDLMGYGWPELGDPVLSQCDVDALAFVFAWAIAGTDPAPPAAGPYEC